MFPDFYIEVLFILLVCQALGFSGILLGIYASTGHHPKKYMAMFMLASAGYFFLTWLSVMGYTHILRYIYPLGMPLLLLHLPFFYWYIRSLTGERFRVNGKQFLHLLPALTILLLQMSFFLLPGEQAVRFLEKGSLSDSYSTLNTILVKINSLSFYIVFSGQLLYYILKYRQALQRYRRQMEDVFSFKEKIDFRWMRTLMIGILLFFLGNDLAYVFRINHNLFPALFFSIGMISINFYIGFHALMQSVVLSNFSSIGKFKAEQTLEAIPATQGSTNTNGKEECQKYKNSALNKQAREVIIEGLAKLMKNEQLYTEPQLSIDQVAARLHVNSKYLSQAINEVYNQNFYNYINELRVRKAKEFLLMESHGQYSVDGIASQVGFQSKSSFYTAFKKSTGVTPAAFRSSEKGSIEIAEEVA
jgi:AraC-like DNA-binding protein